MKWYKHRLVCQRAVVTCAMTALPWVGLVAQEVAERPVTLLGVDSVTLSRADSTIHLDSYGYKKRPKPLKGTPEYYEYRVEAYNRFWRSLIPNQTRFQYAGNVGMFNLGFGWHYGGRERRLWETDFMFGLLLKYNTQHNHLTFTLRQSYIPFRIPLVWHFKYEPLATGLMLNAITGEEFWVREPSKYPHKYYGFPTAIRAHVFLGQRLRWEIPRSKRKYVKAISFCYELSTYDLALVSYFTNDYLSFRDILSLSLGIKVEAF